MFILQLKEERDDADSENVLLQETLSSLEIDEKQCKSERDVLRTRLQKVIQDAKDALKASIRSYMPARMAAMRVRVARPPLHGHPP